MSLVSFAARQLCYDELSYGSDMNLLATISEPFDGGHHGRYGDHNEMFAGAMVGLLLLVAVIVLAVLLLRSRRPSTARAGLSAVPSPAASAEGILSERFARGEMSPEEFVTARAALRGEWTPPSTTP